MGTEDPGAVDAYLRALPAPVREVLQRLRETIAAGAPEATETISYQMPTFKYRGRALVGYAAFKNHCSLFPYSGTFIDEHREQLEGFPTAKGTIRFTVENPLPSPLVQELVRQRIGDIDRRSA